MKQLFANNAETTLSQNLGVNDLIVYVNDVSLFPSPDSNKNEFFKITVEQGSGGISAPKEVIKIVGKTADALLVDSSGATGRRQEETGDVSTVYAAGSIVECRTTRDTLKTFSTALVSIDNVGSLVSPGKSSNSGYVCQSYDPSGNPVIVVAKNEDVWGYLNYTVKATGTVTTADTTGLTSPTALSGTVPTYNSDNGTYLIQFTTGALAGVVRMISTSNPSSVDWALPLDVAPSSGDTFEIAEANSVIMENSSSVNFDAILMALVFGD